MRDLNSDTNKVYRKKYFMDADKVVFSEAVNTKDIEDEVNSLITAEQVAMSDRPVTVTHGEDCPQECIQVEVIKDGDRIAQLKISCPCGRHTEIDVQYN